MINSIKKFFSFVNSPKLISIEESVLKLFSSFPKLPAGGVDFIVSFGPYLVLIGGILGILSVFTLLFVTFIPNVIGAVITGIVAIAAFDELQKRTVFGWRLIFWSGNLSIILSLISTGIFVAIIGAVISWYILSQIRVKYN